MGVSVKALSKAFEGSFRLGKLLSLKWTKKKSSLIFLFCLVLGWFLSSTKIQIKPKVEESRVGHNTFRLNWSQFIFQKT